MKTSNLTQSTKSNSINFMKSVAFFSCLSDNELTELERFVVKKKFSKNDLILLEEDTSHYMYFIYSGKVKAVQISEDGREQILANKETHLEKCRFLTGRPPRLLL